MHFFGFLTFLSLVFWNTSPLPEQVIINSQKQRPEKQANWKLVWADEFNVNGKLNPKNWTYEQGFVRNQEEQWYQPENARCEKGYLIIEGRREKKLNPNYKAGSTDWRTRREYANYTAASLTTKNLHSWQYGRFEMKGRIDIRPGLWPAFWTLGLKGEWPRNGEIDIMEYYRGDLLANTAWGSDKRFTAHWNTFKKPIASFNDPEWEQKFHIWRMDWDEKEIRLYVDDQLLNTTQLENTFNKDKEQQNPFRQPHYILLNLAIGGTNGGDATATTFPSKFEVDYVRVYQQQ